MTKPAADQAGRSAEVVIPLACEDGASWNSDRTESDGGSNGAARRPRLDGRYGRHERSRPATSHRRRQRAAPPGARRARGRPCGGEGRAAQEAEASAGLAGRCPGLGGLAGRARRRPDGRWAWPRFPTRSRVAVANINSALVANPTGADEMVHIYADPSNSPRDQAVGSSGTTSGGEQGVSRRGRQPSAGSAAAPPRPRPRVTGVRPRHRREERACPASRSSPMSRAWASLPRPPSSASTSAAAA